MRLEIRKTGGDSCPECGAFGLVLAGGMEITADLSAIMEREIVRREIQVAKLDCDAMAALGREHAEELVAVAAMATDAANAVLSDAAADLAATRRWAPWWRPLRRWRERRYGRRIAPVVEFLEVAAR